jgi:hypothetical protein
VHLSVSTVLLALAASTPAQADEVRNFLVGPVFGIRLGGPPGPRAIVGIEGGAGIGPERLNLGFTRRLDKMFYYLELDPWLYIGASLGVGIDSDGEPHGIIGVWEGLPIIFPECEDDDGFHRAVTIAAGYRYTGVHELYATIKAGASEQFCLY